MLCSKKTDSRWRRTPARALLVCAQGRNSGMNSSQVEAALVEAGLSLNEDRFGGITLSFEGAAAEIDWASALRAAVTAWRAEKKYRGAWLHISPTQNAQGGAILQAAVEAGFGLHAVHKAIVVLKLWLPPGSVSPLPDAPHHQLGVAGMIINGRGEVLAIQERSGPTAALEGFWKLPGGLVDLGEDLACAVMREVREETGVEAKFDSLVTFRESHAGPFGSTDIYAVCAMTLLGEGMYRSDPLPQPVSPSPAEIKAVAWIPLEEFLGSRYYKRGLYGSLLRTAAAPARAAALRAAAGGKDTTEADVSGMREAKLNSRPGVEESLFFTSRAKL